MREVDRRAFGERVRERREELGLSQAELAEAAGYRQQTIGYYEKGRVKRPQRCASQLAEALETTREWLLYAEGPPGPPPILKPAELVAWFADLSRDEQIRFSASVRKGRKSR